MKHDTKHLPETVTSPEKHAKSIESGILSHKNILNMLGPLQGLVTAKKRKPPQKVCWIWSAVLCFVPFGNFFPCSHDCDKSYQ